MKRRKRTYYILKIGRFSGYCLFFLMLLFVVTGFALCGKLGVERLVSPRDALVIHQLFDWPLVGVFLLHSLAAFYISMRRWRWIR